MSRLLTPAIAALLLTSACAPSQSAPPPATATATAERLAVWVDAEQLMADLRVLAADSMEGRRTGTPGNERARRYLLGRFEQVGVTPIGDGFGQAFRFTGRDGGEYEGLNLIGHVRGTTYPDRYIVVTAHYDHLGVRNGQIYNGADDNASGTAGLLQLAQYFVHNPPAHSIVFAALDAEEMGLRGARAFVADPPVARAAIVLNVNLDMVGRNDANELFAAGTYHSPGLRPLLEAISPAPPVHLRFGHDSPDLPPSDDWTLQSDHGAFHEAGIPFVYFGVEDHPDYHQPTDTADRIQPTFFAAAVSTVLRAVLELDANPDVLAAARR